MVFDEEFQKEADRLMQIPGVQKGTILQSHMNAIKDRLGEESLLKIEQGLSDLGYPVKLKDIRATGLYKESQAALVTLLCQKVLNYTDEDIFNQAVIASKLSFFNRLILKTFVSFNQVLKDVPRYWKKHVSMGELECSEVNEKEKFAILRLKEYAVHPVVCLSLAGFFIGMIRYVEPTATIQETKCIHRGDPYHEFKVNW